MSLPKNLGDREYKKFMEDASGNVSVRVAPGAVVDDDGNILDIDKFGRAQMQDQEVLSQLEDISSILKEMLFELRLINGGS